MCRFLAYQGPPIDVARLVVDAPRSLVHQAQAPRLQRFGTSNPDGYGLAWYGLAPPRNGSDPARHRSALPIWEDASLTGRLSGIASPAFVAHVRSASPGSPVHERNAHPFVASGCAFAHNGAVDAFGDGVDRILASHTSPRRRAVVEGTTDSEALFALTLDALDAGHPPASALARTAALVHAVAPRREHRLNLVITDGRAVAALAWGDSLFTRSLARGGVVASEPLDDEPAWQPVPDRCVVTIEGGSTSVRPVGEEPTA